MIHKTAELEGSRKEEADTLIYTIGLLLREEQNMLELGQVRARHQREMAEQKAELLGEIMEIDASPEEILAGLNITKKEVTFETQSD